MKMAGASAKFMTSGRKFAEDSGKAQKICLARISKDPIKEIFRNKVRRLAVFSFRLCNQYFCQTT